MILQKQQHADTLLARFISTTNGALSNLGSGTLAMREIHVGCQPPSVKKCHPECGCTATTKTIGSSSVAMKMFRVVVLLFSGALVSHSHAAAKTRDVQTGAPVFTFPNAGAWLWTLKTPGAPVPIKVEPPSFELDGRIIGGAVVRMKPLAAPRAVTPFVTEYTFGGALRADPTLVLEAAFRVSSRSPVVRFRYTLRATSPHTLTRPSIDQRPTFFRADLAGMTRVTEVRVSEFVDLFHSYTTHEEPIGDQSFDGISRVMGPLLVASNGRQGLLLGYEHGSAVPRAFLAFRLRKDRKVELEARQGNVLPGSLIDSTHPWSSPWFVAASVHGSEAELADAFRTFLLKDQSTAHESRVPYVYYNTWNLQERIQLRTRSILPVMQTERLLTEIDSAHRLGIEVFVIDVGWFGNSGDWGVNASRFPDGMLQIVTRLKQHQMKLGLWFDPAVAALSSAAYKQNTGLVSRVGGKERRENVWESGEAIGMCMVSEWANLFAKRLIALHRETGVVNFKLDGLRSSACDLPGHQHGDDNMTPQERLDAHDFFLPGALAQVAQQIVDAVPGAIVDLDVTEDARPVGLQFLSAGRYFLVNNGPYAREFDLPRSAYTGGSNLFFNPGPARAWMMRSTFGSDRWIPSVLNLIHYLPDDPVQSQMANLGSMILGGNGIWGDLSNLSAESSARIAGIVARYKEVRLTMSEASPVRSGTLAGSPEVHEKIATQSGNGAVVMFTTSNGHYEYVTRAKPNGSIWSNLSTVKVQIRSDGHAVIVADLKKNETAIVFFGSSTNP